VLEAAEEIGISTDEIVDSLRNDEQRAMMDDARKLLTYSHSISEKAPEPRSRRYGLGRRLSRGPERNRASVHLVGGGGPPIVAQEPGTGARQVAPSRPPAGTRATKKKGKKS
jgi:hypothetical protein